MTILTYTKKEINKKDDFKLKYNLTTTLRFPKYNFINLR